MHSPKQSLLILRNGIRFHDLILFSKCGYHNINQVSMTTYIPTSNFHRVSMITLYLHQICTTFKKEHIYTIYPNQIYTRLQGQALAKQCPLVVQHFILMKLNHVHMIVPSPNSVSSLDQMILHQMNAFTSSVKNTSSHHGKIRRYSSNITKSILTCPPSCKSFETLML